MNTTPAHQVAANVRAELARKGIRASGLVSVLGISRTSIARRVSGQKPFDVAELIAIASLLDMPVTELLSESVSAA